MSNQKLDLVLEKVGNHDATTRTINADGFRIEPNGLILAGNVIKSDNYITLCDNLKR